MINEKDQELLQAVITEEVTTTTTNVDEVKIHVELHDGQFALHKDAVELHDGQFALHKDAVELHDGEFALYEDAVELHDGEFALIEDSVQLKNGEYALTQDSEELFGEWFLEADEDIHTTHCGDRFHISQQDRLDIVWADVDGEYAYDSDTTYGNIRRGTGTWITDDHSSVYVGDEYFVSPSVAELNGYVYISASDEWMSQEEYDEQNMKYVSNYHEKTRRDKRVNTEGWSFGLEVEKEDLDVKEQIVFQELYDNTGWIKERDGSLDDESGFEAVSPIYGLFEKVWEEDFQNQYIKNILNADGTAACGGHFNLGSTEYSPVQLANGLSGFFPLLYAMWEKRAKNGFCEAKKKVELIQQNSKRSAVHIHSNRIEFRIFGRIKSVENAIWRINFVKIMVANINSSEKQVLAMLLNKKSALYKHLSKTYSVAEINERIVKFVKYSEMFNDIKLSWNGNFTTSDDTATGEVVSNNDEGSEEDMV